MHYQSTSQKKILVGDDNLAIIQTIFKYFPTNSQDYDLLGAHNGEIACQLAYQEIPDLIILDWQMPLMNGIEVMTQLKKRAETRLIPVIIVTGTKINDVDLATALEKGAVDYIRKPLNRLELLARAQATLRFADAHKKNKAMIQATLDSKNRELSTIAIQIAQKNKALTSVEEHINALVTKDHSLKSILKLIKNNLDWDNYWDKFKLHFEKVHPCFFETLQKKHPNLTTNELKLCAYIKMNLSRKEIFQMLNVSTRGLETARYRLRKKISLDDKTRLNKYIQSL